MLTTWGNDWLSWELRLKSHTYYVLFKQKKKGWQKLLAPNVDSHHDFWEGILWLLL